MKSHGYHLKNNFSNTSNSKINIYKQLKKYNNLKYNYCSSIYKDSGQLRKRFLRIAKLNKKIYDTITKEGTFIYVIISILKKKMYNFIRKYFVKEKYIICDSIDLQIMKYLNINES